MAYKRERTDSLHTLWQQVIVDRRDTVAPYQQIANSIRHKIATNQLSPGTSLPSVRSLAQIAHVTTATVTRAYHLLQDEQLIEVHAGIGAIVSDIEASQKSLDTDFSLDETLERFVLTLLSQGYDLLAIRTAMRRKLNQFNEQRRIAFVAAAPAVVHKYASTLSRELGGFGIDIVPLTLNEIRRPGRGTKHSLSGIEHVVTLLSFLREVKDIVNDPAVLVTTLLTELTYNTAQRLHDMPEDARIALVAEQHYRTTGLGMLQSYCRDDHITVVRCLDQSSLRHAFDDVNLVVHTLGTSDLVKEVITPKQQAIELEFQVRSDSLSKLKESVLNLSFQAQGDVCEQS
jgi:DNA-binding transcriptional regulator YhcF (GntR family)